MTAVSLLCLPVTFKTLISCDLFNTVSCLNFVGHLFIAVSTCIEACFVEESIYFLPIFSLGFCPLLSFSVGKDDEKVIITFDFGSMESLEEEGDFLGVICTFSCAFDCTLVNFVLVFGKRFPCNRGKWGLFYGDFIRDSAIFMTEILKVFRGFAPASWQARPKDHQLATNLSSISHPH